MKKILILLAVVFFTSACSAYYSRYYDNYDLRSGWYGSNYSGYYGNYLDGNRSDRHGVYRDRGDRHRDDRDRDDRSRNDKNHGGRDYESRDYGDRDWN